MGQSPSKFRSRSATAATSAPEAGPDNVAGQWDDAVAGDDNTLNLPDECVACIFQLLPPGDRKRSSLVCRRWLRIDGENRHRLSLNAESQLAGVVPRLFSRFDRVTKLTLKCDRRSISIGDETLTFISQQCVSLTRLKLRACRELTDDGIAAFSQNCKKLQKFSCVSCNFGAKGVNSVIQNCAFLEELSVKRLHGITEVAEAVSPGKAAGALKVICLKDLHNGQCFAPLIAGAKNLRSLKLIRCSGNWDKLLEFVVVRINGIVEVHLERVHVSDLGLSAVSNLVNLEILRLVKTPECSDIGVMAVAEKCRLIRKLHIDGWRTNRIGDDGLIAVATHCCNLQELVLIGVNPTGFSMEKLATNCGNLERLALCGSETVGDAEISCIAAKCNALKRLCIKSCPVSNQGMETLVGGCPSLVKVKVKKCRGVTSEGADWLRARRGSLAVNLDTVVPELQDVSILEQESSGVDVRPIRGRVNAASRRSTLFKMRLGSFTGRRFFAGTLRRWSSFGGRFLNNKSGRSNAG